MHWNVIATEPPHIRKPYAGKIAWILAGVMIFMAVAHLIRIDKLIPVIEQTLPGVAAMWFVALLVIAEVLTVPYLLMMRLSPLFRMKSGAMVVFVPLVWTCFTVWALGNGQSTGQFTSYVSTPASWWLVVLNLAWLGVSFWALWLLDFNRTVAALRKKR